MGKIQKNMHYLGLFLSRDLSILLIRHMPLINVIFMEGSLLVKLCLLQNVTVHFAFFGDAIHIIYINFILKKYQKYISSSSIVFIPVPIILYQLEFSELFCEDVICFMKYAKKKHI